MDERIEIGAFDRDRYDRSRRIDWLDLESVFRARALIVGAGALGNEVAKNLVLSGFKRVTVVDMDHVVPSNLNRCVFFTEEHAAARAGKAEVVAAGVHRLSEDAVAKPITAKIEDLGEGVFREHDIVLGCLDNIAARIHANSHSYASGRVYIDGGTDGFRGKVMVSKPPDGACLQCAMNKTHAKIATLRFSCTGSGIVFHEPRQAAEITTTSVISAIMVREALKSVSGRLDMALCNAFYYDGEKNISEEMEIPLDPACPVHLGSR